MACLHAILLLSTSISVVTCAGKVPMKVVEEPSSFGWNVNNWNNNVQDARGGALKLKTSPLPFSGPPHMRALKGLCFSKVVRSYRWELCPFENATQHEEAVAWNAFHGVIGVWAGWNITNNTFNALLFTEGDPCGAKNRSASVSFFCGETNLIDRVEEPSTCTYAIAFASPLVCHPDSLLVYPTLSEPFRHDWDLLVTWHQSGDLTDRGFELKQQQLFTKAGFSRPPPIHAAPLPAPSSSNATFSSLASCNSEYEKLKRELDQLQQLYGTLVRQQREDNAIDDDSP